MRTYKNKNTKIYSEGLTAIYTKICTFQNFPLYGIRILPRNFARRKALVSKIKVKGTTIILPRTRVMWTSNKNSNGSQNIIKTSNCHCNVIASMHKVCKRHNANMCNICNSNASNFRNSELRALNIEYFRYVCGEAYNTVAPLCHHLPSKIFLP